MAIRESAGQPVLPAEFLASIIDNVAHPIFVKDREFRFVLLNSALADLVGHSREEMLGKTDFDFFPEQEAGFFRQKDMEAFATGEQVVIDEEPITDASGVQHILATTKVPLRDASGEVTHLVGIIHDISRLKRAEDLLRLANEELEARVKQRTQELVEAQARLLRNERLAVLGQLSGGLAHQIRSPLAAITNAGFILRRRLASHADPDVRQTVDILLEEAAAASRIIQDLVEYARVRPPARASVSPAALVSEVLATVPIPSGVAVTRAVDGASAVMVDTGQVVSALANVVRNAVEAMPEGGTLVVRASESDGQVALTVEDSGTGIAPEILARLFEPLVTTKALGLGLGLPTARYLVENQGGTLTCERTGESGSVFRLSLPTASSMSGDD